MSTLLITLVVYYVVTRVAKRAGLTTIPPAVEFDVEPPTHPDMGPDLHGAPS